MEIKIIEETKNLLRFEIKGDSGIANALKNELWNDPNIKVSGSTQNHPLVGSPEIYVETSKGSPKDAVMAAIDRIKKSNDKLKKSIAKEL
jgi:DNA-directed RNA polymerase subunit L